MVIIEEWGGGSILGAGVTKPQTLSQPPDFELRLFWPNRQDCATIVIYEL